MYRNRARRQEIGRTFLDEIHARTSAVRPVSPDALMEHASQEALLADCLSQLRDEERIVLTLRYWKEMSVDDSADVMGKSVAAIRKRLLRVQQRLKELMISPGCAFETSISWEVSGGPRRLQPRANRHWRR